ncbi:MAG: O-antigen ligase family protein [Planctomycetota bacterium]|jgi:O-antigen ligase|nr:O-antigen ligase family protein [Planctomycetota bacterium]
MTTGFVAILANACLALAFLFAPLFRGGLYVFTVLALGLALGRLARAGKTGWRWPDREERWLGGVFLWAFLTTLPQTVMDWGYSSRALDHGSRFLLAGLLFVVLVSGKVRLKEQWLGLSLLGAGILSGLYALQQFFFQEMTRVAGGISIQSFGDINTILFFLALLVVIFAKGKTWPVLGGGAMSLAFISVILSGLRTNWLALGLTTLVVLGLVFRQLKAPETRRRIGTALLLCLVLAGVIAVVPPFRKVVEARTQAAVSDITTFDPKTGAKTSVGARFLLWEAAYLHWRESPLLGLGFKRRVEVNNRLLEEGEITIQQNPYGTMHNEFLNALSLRGLVGASTILLLYLAPLVFFLRRWKRMDSQTLPAALFGLAVVLAFFFCGFSGEPLYLHLSATFYSLVILATVSVIKQQERETTPELGKAAKV